ncbi:MAG: CarD family transcriptional regulator [Spirochaetaceae bacterium]|jgi:CarD family transcriptional regulator|nr:CarD family transcriptional regulator [Spirochaetaceae bacterium]
MSEQSTAFSVDQKVVYPSQGVGKIMQITERKFREETLLYYVIYLEVSDMTVMVPVDKVEELGIRAIVSPEEAQKALDMISEAFEPIPSDWKLRYQMNLELLKKGSVLDIAAIVRSLYHRSKVKELPILERKLYDSAKKLLEDEISFALDKPAKEVEALIHSHLEPFGAVTETKRSVMHAHMDDDEDTDFMDDENDDASGDMDNGSDDD